MIFRQLFDKISSTYTYLIASAAGREALIIDPVLENVEQYIKLLKEFLESTSDAYQGLFFETAHPIKFVETVENTLKTSIEVPERLKGILNRKKESVSIQTYEQLKSFLLES